ncbi:MAG: alpha/beta hydrolase [Myxococcales bacterium]|nr:alpha/beta hydrolase [Myxococcales bacterium]
MTDQTAADDATISTVEADGLRFAYRERGEGPLVLCLHGFPDTAYTFDGTLEVLAQAGYRAVAPFMRGYPPTERPADDDFGLGRLGRDAVALIDALGAHEAAVVGHDWGALAAYVAANLAPDKVRAIATAAVPHVRALRPTAAQARRSWYMLFFQLRLVAERAVRARDFALIDRLWRDWSPSWRYTEDDIRPVKEALADPDGLASALGYYRAMMFPGALDPSQRRLVFGRVSVPAITFAGMEDGCMGIEMFDETPACFTGPYELVRVAGAGHFMHREKPEFVHGRLLEFLGKLPK